MPQTCGAQRKEDMKSQLLKVIAGTAIATTLGVTALGVVTTASAKTSGSTKQAQAIDLVIPTKSDSGEGRSEKGGRHGGPALESVATVLNLTVEQLKTQLDSGKSLADVAKAQSVDVAKVISAIVADTKAHLAAEVASGEHTQAEVDAKLSGLTARVTEMVNKVRPAHDHD